jgi:signal transduction histidine kinase
MATDEAVIDGAMRRAGVADAQEARRQATELLQCSKGGGPPAELALPSAERAGAAAAEAGERLDAAVRSALLLGRALVAEALEQGARDAAAVARLGALVDEAAARAALGHARFLDRRRDDWLSFIAHELKNRLNTVLNAIWLLREGHGAPSGDRFLQLAERAVRRMEDEVHGLRGLEKLLATAPPKRP